MCSFSGDLWGLGRKKEALVLDLPYNMGIGGAVQTGCRYAFQHEYEFALRLDGDGQHHPQEGAKILNPLLKGEADIVIGSRFLSKEGYKSTFLRRMGIRFFSLLKYSPFPDHFSKINPEH